MSLFQIVLFVFGVAGWAFYFVTLSLLSRSQTLTTRATDLAESIMEDLHKANKNNEALLVEVRKVKAMVRR